MTRTGVFISHAHEDHDLAESLAELLNRDLIDLAMLEPPRSLLTRAIEKAATAYGKNIEQDLARAKQRLKVRSGRLDECMEALKIDRVPKAELWSRIRRLMPPAAR